MENSEVPNVPVSIGIPASNTAIIIVRSGTIDYLLFGKVKGGVFKDHVSAFNGTNRCERVTGTTGVLELD